MFYTILIILAVLLAVLLIVIATRPGHFRYSRSQTIASSPQHLFEQVNDLRKFQHWNPWAAVDPSAVLTYAGPESGIGSSYTWVGNRNVGEGTMTIVDSRPGEQVRARMDFRKPFAAVNEAEFLFEPEGSGTRVTWSMHGPSNFMGKAMGLLINCDKMVGDQFAKGLATLKSQAESHHGAA